MVTYPHKVITIEPGIHRCQYCGIPIPGCEIKEMEKTRCVYHKEVAQERQSRLDLFAAAALTGLISSLDRKVDSSEVVRVAWAVAREMLDNEPKDD